MPTLNDFNLSRILTRVGQSASDRTTPQQPPFPNTAKEARIMIADDSSRMRAALRRMIERQLGWKVCAEEDNGESIIQRVQALRPDLLLLDIRMPSMNGLDAAQILAETAPDVPILIVTMHAVKEYRARALAIGVRGYVLKSESPWTIISAIQAVLRNETFFSNPDLFHD